MKNLEEPKFNSAMINNLVMDEHRLTTIKALSKSFARLNSKDEKLESEAWSADFIKGKGSGLIFLLHGSPGVGKRIFNTIMFIF